MQCCRLVGTDEFSAWIVDNVIRQVAPLFSKVDSNKLWHDVQHDENVIYAQFGKDLLNISKVIGRITVIGLTVYHTMIGIVHPVDHGLH